MRVVDHVLVWRFGKDVISPESTLIIVYSYTNSQTWICYSGPEESLFLAVLRHYVSQNIDVITVTLLLNRFDIVQIHFVLCI